ncbi:hypothetical protein AB0G15_04875 [Streptosporangium sp. NPDC023825]|uniref:hypothetical protein n=1 Tax=Streptosporangium sp. NPDC023825 TaxID=3154909 RepID=UPI003420F724
MRRCTDCGCWEYGGAPGCARCAALVDRIVEDGWRGFLQERFGGTGLSAEEESAIAEMVADEPDRHDWRLGLPALLDGFLPTTAQAQAMRARINAGAGYDDLAGRWGSSFPSDAEATGPGRRRDVKNR